MIRLFLLAAVLLGLGCNATQAGMMYGDTVESTSSMTTAVDLADLLNDELPPHSEWDKRPDNAGLGGSTVIVNSGTPTFACTRITGSTIEPVIGETVAFSNSLLPPPPDLGGLIKPPQA